MSRDYVLQPYHSAVHLQIDYARELNPQQLAAVTAPPGPALVIAGAGSGKTRTLTYRVAYLLEQGIPPERILLLTFTNKAAAEMMRRVSDLIGRELRELWGGTFHSIGARILRTHAETLGYRRDFTILDRDDSKDLIKACVADAGIETKGTHFPKPEVLNEIFSLAVNTHKSEKEILETQFSYFDQFADKIADVSQRYVKRKRATNAMDFDDLLALWLKLLQENADAREMYQRRFQFILVDEYQDTNKLQGDLIDLLAARHHNVTVVGDDAQSIYAWRGANFQNILEFPKRYPKAQVFKIETNYRSTPEILQVANAAISANRNQFTKTLTPSRKSGVKPALIACMDAAQQSAFICQRVLELHEEGTSLNQIAVLYRSHFHALELQLELTKRQILFSITSGIRFFEQAHIKDATAYLKLVTNPRDEIAFKRVAQLHPGIAAKGAEKLWKIFNAEVESLGSARAPRASDGASPSEQSMSSKLNAIDEASTATREARVLPESALSERDGGVTKAKYSRRNLPHFERPWAKYMVTFSTRERRQLAPSERDLVLQSILYAHEHRQIQLFAACVMPDHVHLLFEPQIKEEDKEGKTVFWSLSEILQGIKSASAHNINKTSGIKGHVWEKESMDRMIRGQSDLEEKFHYICRNPWDAGVVTATENYAWVWTPDNAGQRAVDEASTAAREARALPERKIKFPIATALETCAPFVGKKAAVAWAQFVATAAQLEEEKSPAKMLRIVIDAGYDDYLKENFANARVRLEDLEQLAVFAYQFPTTEDFLTQLALLTNVEAENDNPKSDDERIKLSTIHQAKGLEFDAVFVIMLCDGLFPSARSIDSDEGEEEERRLFYVAITRAKNELYLSYPLIRAGFGQSAGDTMQHPSRFLSEIPKELLNEWNLRTGY